MAELDWDDLRYFLRCTQQKTLAGAARSLGVEHTTVSRRLQHLEAALGTSLALRSADGLRLTQTGNKVAGLLGEIERLVADVQRTVAGEQARLRIAIPSAFVELFATRLAALTNDAPELALELVSSARVVDLRRGEADLAIRVGPVLQHDDALIVRKLGDVGSALYAARRYVKRYGAPKDVDDPASFRGHRLIAFDASMATLPAAEWLEARAVQASIALRCREMVDVLAATRGGLGLSVLPCYLGDADKQLVRLSKTALMTRPVYLVYPREARVSPSFRAVVRFVVDVMTEQAATLRGTTVVRA